MTRDVGVLILTSELDFASDRVCRELANSGTNFLRLNRETLSESNITLVPSKGTLSCRNGDKTWSVGNNLRSIWWRQGTFDRNIFFEDRSVEKQFERSQWSAFMRSLMVLNNSTWVNHPSAVYHAETKAVQLRQAIQSGFYVPDTLMTNDRLANVEATMGHTVALKSIDTLLLRDGDEQLFGYTTLMEWEIIADEHLHLAPATIQAPLLDKLDLRVTIVGEKLWCVAIKRYGEGIAGDWRLTSKSEIEIEDHELPVHVSESCHKLVRDLGLKFGAIDLAISDGRYWFIEINPTGEWGWLNSDTRPIAAAIAHFLGDPC